MKKFFQMIGKKKWAIGVMLVCFVAFCIFMGYENRKSSHAAEYIIRDSEGNEVSGSYELRRAVETFYLDGFASGDQVKWSSLNTEILSVNAATANTSTVEVTVNSIGAVALRAVVTHTDGTEETFTASINVQFSINEFLNNNTPVKINRVLPNDSRRSIVMNYNDILYLGKSAKTERDRLNLIFGDATDVNAVWSTANSDIIRLNNSNDGSLIKAVGAGRTDLTVTYRDGIHEYTDTIKVYVRPEIRKDDDKGAVIGTDSTPVLMENGDKIWVSALYATNPLEGILDKVTWVIVKRSGETRTLVRDSLGNKGADGDSANLVFNANNGTFRLDAKAGQYIILFYVRGTYKDFETAQDPEYVLGCEPVFVNVDVNSNFTDKDVTISIDGNYDLSEAFNISLDALKENFSVLNMENDGKFIRYEPGKMLIHGLAQGTVSFVVRCNTKPTYTIPGIDEGDEVNVTVTVTDTFTLNVTSTTMAVGSELELSGIIGSGQYTDSSTFSWSTTDESETYISISSSGQYATVTAKKETQSDSPVVVSLSWTNEEGVTRVASCKIFVNTSATTITLDQTEIEMEVGSITYLDSGLSGDQNLTWISSNTDIVKVEPQKGNTSAKLTAGDVTGTTTVTVLNKDNDAYATCKVTVTAAITDISIDKGEQYDTVLSEGFVFLKAIYEPKNATNTELKWSSSDKSVATVDENGVVTLLKEDTVWISVEPVFNPKNIVARCCINIKENPVTEIKTDVSELDMIAGDQYTVNTEIVPEDATNPTLVWASDNENIAKVEGGVITAIAPGDANITVANGTVFKIIKVHVRARLLSIEFEQTEYTIKEGDTAKLNVIFNPAENVNTNLTWTTTNEEAVSVDKDGNITGVKAGEMAMITCIAEDLGVEGAISCIVKVIEADVIAEDMQLDPVEGIVYVGGTLQMNAVFSPATTTNQEIIWASSDESLATIDSAGVITGVAEGDVIITAVYNKTKDGVPIVRNANIKVVKAPVPVEGITFNPAEFELFIGATYTLNPIFAPENATNRSVTFQCTDPSVATVDEKGVVTGIASGSAVIICRTVDGGHIASATVKVIQGVSLELNPSVREIALGKTFKIKAKVLPEVSDKTMTWESSNPKIATVTQKGKVRGVKKGKCTITCTLVKYNVKATCKVTVATLRTTIKLSQVKIRMGKGETYKLKAIVWSNNSTTPKVKWNTSKWKIASVNQKGKVKAKKLGYATITATTKDKIKAKAKCKVRVIRRAKGLRIEPNYAVCYIGGTANLTAVVKPSNASIKSVKWKSSDPNIAKIEDGTVRGLAEGTVTITATTKDGSNKSATCLLKVMEEIPASSVVVAQTELTMKRGDSTKIAYSVLPTNTSDSITFASDNKRVATVSANGTVKAVGTGNCTITILTSGGTTATVAVNVVELNRATLTMRQYDTETLSVNGTTETVTWYSANARVATVENGKVVGRSKGTTYIYAYVKGCKMACKVTITDIP